MEVRDERRCHARSKRSGARCRRLAIPGGTVCVMHGGAAPQVAAAARRRLIEQAAIVACERVAAIDAFLAEAAGIPPTFSPSVDAYRAATQLRRARRRAPRWWASADEYERRAYWKLLGREVYARLSVASDEVRK